MGVMRDQIRDEANLAFYSLINGSIITLYRTYLVFFHILVHLEQVRGQFLRSQHFTAKDKDLITD